MTLPRRVESIVSRPLGAKIVLFNPDSREVSVLNGTAAVVWELCDGETPVAEVVARLQARFRIAEARDVRGDVAGVLQTLRERGLVHSPAPAGSGDATG